MPQKSFPFEPEREAGYRGGSFLYRVLLVSFSERTSLPSHPRGQESPEGTPDSLGRNAMHRTGVNDMGDTSVLSCSVPGKHEETVW